MNTHGQHSVPISEVGADKRAPGIDMCWGGQGRGLRVAESLYGILPGNFALRVRTGGVSVCTFDTA